MPGAIYKQGNGEVAQSSVRGKAFISKLNNRLSPSTIEHEQPKTQECEESAAHEKKESKSKEQSEH